MESREDMDIKLLCILC